MIGVAALPWNRLCVSSNCQMPRMFSYFKQNLSLFISLDYVRCCNNIILTFHCEKLQEPLPLQLFNASFKNLTSFWTTSSTVVQLKGFHFFLSALNRLEKLRQLTFLP